MINPAVFRKSVYEARWLWITCALVLFLFCWIHVLVTSQVDMGRFETLLDNLPKKWEKFAPVPFKQMISYPARIAIIYDEPLVVMLMTIWCVSRGSDSVSGELGRGTMEMLLAQPVSRLQVLLSPVVVTVGGVALLAVVAWLGTCTGIATASVERPAPGSTWTIPFTAIQLGASDEMERIPMRTLAPYKLFVPPALNYFSLGIFLSGVCTLVSSFDRYRWRTIGLFMAFFILQMLARLLGMAFESMAWVKKLTFFGAYEPVVMVSTSVGEPTFAWTWLLRDEAGNFAGVGPLGCDA
ncbi:MAG: ABC transporter permease subunit, partial [Planctomycetota bacterium]